MNRRPAFTLVEIVVVITIVGIAATAVAPAFRASDGTTAAAAARALEKMYERARTVAAARGSPVRVVYESRSRRYHALLRRHGAARRTADTVDVGRVPERVGVRIEGADARVTVAMFDPLGGARARPVTLTDGERRYVITVDPWTARIETRSGSR